MLGAEKVGEVLNDKLALVLGDAAAGVKSLGNDDDEPKFGKVAHDAAGLMDLVQTRPDSWQWAAFGSVLVQRREVLKAEVAGPTASLWSQQVSASAALTS